MSATKKLIEAITAGEYDNTFSVLYGLEPERIAAQRARYTEAVLQFERLYGDKLEISLYSTPGRTEIGGNHTDHNHGIVMAAAVNLDIIAVVAKNDENVIRVKSYGFNNADSVKTTDLEPIASEKGTSVAMIRGVAAGIVQRGGVVGGFDAYTTSDVLRGSGLSSSAAFEVCMGEILNCEYNNGKFTAIQLGMISQYAENEFFGKPSGLMDQTACAVGSAITIDFANPQNPLVEEVPLDLSRFGFKLVITDTKGSHANLTDEYAAICDEMKSVAAFFGKKVLREVDTKEFYTRISEVRAALNDRAVLRSIHFFEECRRAKELKKAARSGEFETFLSLINEGGNSSFEYNQNAYSAADPGQQGVSLGLALSQLVLMGRGAWRLQGGGFAGTIQAFVPNELLDTYCETLTRVFGSDACYVLAVRGVGSTRIIAR